MGRAMKELDIIYEDEQQEELERLREQVVRLRENMRTAYVRVGYWKALYIVLKQI